MKNILFLFLFIIIFIWIFGNYWYIGVLLIIAFIFFYYYKNQSKKTNTEDNQISSNINIDEVVNVENNINSKKSWEIEKEKREKLRNDMKQNLGITNNYIIIDIETTGLDFKKNEIIEICALKYKNDKLIDTFNTLVKPQNSIPSEITKITGITNEDVKDKNEIDIVIKNFYDFINDYEILIGHNIDFDIDFIYYNLKKYHNIELNKVLMCTLRASRYFLADELDNYKLETIKNHLELNLESHRAKDDCLATNELYRYLARKKGLRVFYIYKNYKKGFLPFLENDTKLLNYYEFSESYKGFSTNNKDDLEFILNSVNEMILELNNNNVMNGIFSNIDNYKISNDSVFNYGTIFKSESYFEEPIIKSFSINEVIDVREDKKIFLDFNPIDDNKKIRKRPYKINLYLYDKDNNNVFRFKIEINDNKIIDKVDVIYRNDYKYENNLYEYIPYPNEIIKYEIRFRMIKKELKIKKIIKTTEKNSKIENITLFE